MARTFRQAQVEVALWRGQARHWQDQAVRLEADNQQLRGRVAELEARVAGLAEQVAALGRVAFGAGSEKTRSPAGGVDVAGGPGGRRRRGQQPGSAGHGRRDYSGLPTVQVTDQVPVAARVCVRCGRPYVRAGEQASELIDWQVRLQRVVHRRVRWRRACQCPVPAWVVAPPPPRPIPKGRFTAGFVARLVCDKYVLGRPLARIGMALADDGLHVAQGTLVGVLDKTSGLLWPLEQQIWARNRASGHLHVDETGWKVFQPLAGKHSNRWWCWVFVGADTTVFRIAPKRSTQVLADQLGICLDAQRLEPGRHLLLSSDFFTVYQALSQLEGVDPLWCWAHVRRRFLDAGEVHPELAGWAKGWRERIGVLYVAHRAVQHTRPATGEHTSAVAALQAALGDIDHACHTQAADPGLPQAAHAVLASLDRQWPGLVRHLDYPRLPLDNNPAERALRGPVIGRKNYYGAGSLASARLAARAWTITATCQQAGASPLGYLTAYLDACAANGGQPPTGPALRRFLPWQATPDQLAAWHNGDTPAP